MTKNLQRPGISAWATLLFVVLLSAPAAARDLGIDISHYQGESGMSQTTWNTVKSSGRPFAVIKATEGLTGPDDGTMATNLARATQAGVITGVYHYAHAENRPTTAGAILEADHFMSYAGSAIGPGHLRPALDLEGASLSLDDTMLTSWVIAFVNRVAEVKGIDATPIIYTSLSVAQTELDSRLANYDLWVANWNGADPQTGNPGDGVFNNWVIWQYTSTGSINGVTMDLDVVHSEYKPLLSLVTPLNGDFNRDGYVNTADYVTWRKKNLSQAQYDAWKNNYGTALPGFVPPPTGGPRGLIPEPATLASLTIALLFGVSGRRANRD